MPLLLERAVKAKLLLELVFAVTGLSEMAEAQFHQELTSRRAGLPETVKNQLSLELFSATEGMPEDCDSACQKMELLQERVFMLADQMTTAELPNAIEVGLLDT